MNLESLYRYKCECGEVLLSDEFLEAPNPFERGTLIACPHCKEVASCSATITRLCDVSGCMEPSSIGQRGADGVYRITCAAHAK